MRPEKPPVEILREISEQINRLKQTPDPINQSYLGLLTDCLCNSLKGKKLEFVHIKTLADCLSENPRCLSPRMGLLVIEGAKKELYAKEKPLRRKGCLLAFLSGAYLVWAANQNISTDEVGVPIEDLRDAAGSYFEIAGYSSEVKRQLAAYLKKAALSPERL